MNRCGQMYTYSAIASETPAIKAIKWSCEALRYAVPVRSSHSVESTSTYYLMFNSYLQPPTCLQLADVCFCRPPGLAGAAPSVGQDNWL